MNRTVFFLVFVCALVFGAGCSSSKQASQDGLFVGSGSDQGMTPVLSNSGSPLPSSVQPPSQIRPQ